METLQDDFHQAVSSRFGHARFLTSRDRRTRAEHMRIRELEAENAYLKARLMDLKLQQSVRPAATHDLPSPETLVTVTAVDEFQGEDNQHEDFYAAENAAFAATLHPVEIDEDFDPEADDFEYSTTGDDDNTPRILDIEEYVESSDDIG